MNKPLPTDANGLPKLVNGAVIHTKAFTAHYFQEGNQDGKPDLSLDYKRSQAKKSPGHYFVMMLLGVDDGPGQENPVDPDAALRSKGWAGVDDVVDAVLQITKDHKDLPRDALVQKVFAMLEKKSG